MKWVGYAWDIVHMVNILAGCQNSLGQHWLEYFLFLAQISIEATPLLFRHFISGTVGSFFRLVAVTIESSLVWVGMLKVVNP